MYRLFFQRAAELVKQLMADYKDLYENETVDKSTSNEMEVSIEKYKVPSAVSNMQTAEMNLPNR